MDDYDQVISTVVPIVIESIREYADDLESQLHMDAIGDTRNGMTEKEHYAFYSKMLKEMAELLGTASILANG